jgi:putative membrane protein
MIDTALWIAAGAALGLVTGLAPGLHVNTLAAIGIALGAAHEAAAWVLLAAGTVHTIVNILPATFLGAPDDDDVLVVLPAHRLLADGRGIEAIHISVAASVAGLVLAAAAAPVYGWLLVGPPQLIVALDDAAGWIAAALLAWLWWREARHGPAAAARATVVMAASGGVGWWALHVGLQGPSAAEPSPLLPLLGGLFGLAGLIASAGSPAATPTQAPPPRRLRLGNGVPWAVGLASFTAVLPGITAAAATSLLPRHEEPARAVAALSALNTAHAVLAMHVLFLTGRVRTGLADAVGNAVPVARWTAGGPTPAAVEGYVVLLIAGVVGAAGTLVLGSVIARHADRFPLRTAALVAGGLLAVITWYITGMRGVLLLAVCACIGLTTIRAGVRRVTLTACLLVPAVLRAFA